LKFAFSVFDEEDKGVITRAELSKILKANHMARTDAEVQRKTETIMTQADKQGNGMIRFEDFVTISRKFPNILFPSYDKW
jgi:serine/threonine-protein phosphatase 2B regulatory subunit